jgi:kynurenine 3-monooxygenase
MRDKTASRKFRAKKKLDHLLEAALPGVYLPLYTMVTFTCLPYARAARRARLQDRILYSTLVAMVLTGFLALATLLARSQRH